MNLNYQHIGTRIKAERKRMRLSQAQLAELVDLSVQYISQIERGVRHLSLDVIANISVTLNAPVDMLLFGTYRTENKRVFCDRKGFGDYSPNEQNAIIEIALAVKTILNSYKING